MSIREAFKDVVRVALLRTRPPVGEEGEEVGRAETSQLEPTGALFR